MSRMYRFLIVGLLTLSVWMAASAAPVRRIDLAAAIADTAMIATNRYPDADSLLVDSVYTEAYEPDGASTAWNEDLVKVLTEAGRREAQMQQHHFNIAYGTVTVVRAQIIKPDGRCVTVDVARAFPASGPTIPFSNIRHPSDG